jgi:hypothetical protein
VIPFAASLVSQIFSDLTSRVEWDENFDSGNVLEQTAERDVIHISCKAAWPTPPRDLCLAGLSVGKFDMSSCFSSRIPASVLCVCVVCVCVRVWMSMLRANVAHNVVLW